MRRGLISHSKIELPDAVLDARLERVRAAMAEAHLDAVVVYSNNTRPAGVSWLTGFVPYWSEALLVVPGDGAPYLVVALTYRVKSWIERTSRVADVIHTPRIGLGAAQRIAAGRPEAAVGIADLDGLPIGIVEDLREGGAHLTFADASALFARLRAKADPAEIALAVRAASIAHSALAAAQGDSIGTMIAAVEAQARSLGAEEIYMAAAPDLARDHRLMRIEGEAALGESYALRATVAYKGTWVRLSRTFCETAIVQAATARFAQAVAQLPRDGQFTGFGSWLVEGCRMAQPLDPIMGSRVDASRPPMPGALVSVQAALVLDGRTVLVGAPALLGQHGEAASLLIAPMFD
jgi:hypothetical protein